MPGDSLSQFQKEVFDGIEYTFDLDEEKQVVTIGYSAPHKDQLISDTVVMPLAEFEKSVSTDQGIRSYIINNLALTGQSLAVLLVCKHLKIPYYSGMVDDGEADTEKESWGYYVDIDRERFMVVLDEEELISAAVERTEDLINEDPSYISLSYWTFSNFDVKSAVDDLYSEEIDSLQDEKYRLEDEERSFKKSIKEIDNEISSLKSSIITSVSSDEKKLLKAKLSALMSDKAEIKSKLNEVFTKFDAVSHTLFEKEEARDARVSKVTESSENVVDFFKEMGYEEKDIYEQFGSFNTNEAARDYVSDTGAADSLDPVKFHHVVRHNGKSYDVNVLER